MGFEGKQGKARRISAALLVVLALVLFVSLVQQPATEVADVQPTRQRAVAGESGIADPQALPEGSRDNPPPLTGWTHSPRYADDTPEQHGLLLGGNFILRSSPVIAEIVPSSPGQEVSVGGSDGRLYVYSANGRLLWSKQVSPPCSDSDKYSQLSSAPAVGELFGNGVSYVVVGYGTIERSSCDGGVVAYRGSDGAETWRYSLRVNSPNEELHGVISSPALADTDGDGRMEVGFGGFDRDVHILNADGSVRWRYHAADTVWSSPAFVNVDGDPQLEMVIGTDITGNPQMIPPTQDGGYVYAFDTHQRPANLFNDPGSYLWRTFFDQVIYSSPAIGDVWSDNPGLEAVVGTGCSFPTDGSNKRGKYIKILRLSDGSVLQTLNTDACVQSSPALGDIDDDGQLEIVATVSGHENIGGSGLSHLMAWDANNPAPKWSVVPRNSNDGNNDPFGGDLQSPVIADLDGNGSLEVAVASVWSVGVFAGKTGAPLTCQGEQCGKQTSLYAWFTVKSTPAVGDIDEDGDLELVIGGAHLYKQDNGIPRGFMYAWTNFAGKLTSPAGAQQPYSMAWPMFRSNATHSGIYALSFRRLETQPSELALMVKPGTTLTKEIVLNVANAPGTTISGASPIGYTVSETDPDNILQVNATVGTVPGPVKITVRAPSAPGVYSGAIKIQAAGLSLNVPVTAVVSDEIQTVYLPQTMR